MSYAVSDRRKFTPNQKVAILKEHLLEKIPVSEVCNKHGIQPTQFYKWQKQFFENGRKAFEISKLKSKTEPLQVKIDQLQEKLNRKNEVVSELMET
ncbi:MAG: transposase, partial [Pyrinomonadaceae bacterium]